MCLFISKRLGTMKTTKTCKTEIWVGLREGYSDIVHTMNDVTLIVSNFVNEKKECVTITPTEFWYVNGWEPGVIIGFINYPRFPSHPSAMKNRAIELAKIFKIEFKQIRISVTTPTITYMLEDE
jgi:hypothetical protein